jgi:hypothetical protein
VRARKTDIHFEESAMIEKLAWVAAVLVMLGATMDALNLAVSRYRFILYLIANGLSLMYVLTLRSHPLLWQLGVMLLSNLIGLWRWPVIARPHRTEPDIRLKTAYGCRESMLARLFRRRAHRSGWTRERVRVRSVA